MLMLDPPSNRDFTSANCDVPSGRAALYVS
jgi:hypothetical protein